MASRFINVTFVPPNTIRTGQGENQLEVVRGEDSVTWILSGFEGRIEVLFQVFMPKGGLPPITDLSPFGNQLSPTTGPTIGPANVPGTAAIGLYSYKLLLDGQPLLWDPPLFSVGTFNANFGGIIIRDPD